MYLLTRKDTNMPSGFNDTQSFCFGYVIWSCPWYEINQWKTVTWPYYCWFNSELFVCILFWTFKNVAHAVPIMTHSLFICDIRQHLIYAIEDISVVYEPKTCWWLSPEILHMYCMSTRVGGGVKEWNVKNVTIVATPHHNGKCIFQHLTKPFEVLSKYWAKLITFWLYIQACEWY